ncbi:hypothetical protein B0H17DRAFT_1044091 [Mycena rosella]|uniref:Uncharacterized protein n=1 Tax=Mycena rosella TaxID=1033263 RepID=A0AAD7E110_MYCRO|nr:hypothetical protein B0H17DRAFT_1044091 [Mycena rosella]
MRPSAACMVRKLSKPLKPNMQIFARPTATQADPQSAIPRIVPREKLARRTSILPAPVPRNHEIKPPTLIETLMARKLALGDKWPPNLRIEPVISRETWAPVQKGLRSKLKKMLREE